MTIRSIFSIAAVCVFLSCGAQKKAASNGDTSLPLSMNETTTNEGWTITHNGKVLAGPLTDDKLAPTLKISMADLSSAGDFTITYVERKDADLIRSFMVEAAQKELILKEKATKLTLSNKELKGLLDNNATLEFYTMGIPADPEVAQRVRVRRFHLCSIVRQ